MLNNFLNAKPLYYDKIDYTRMPRIYDKIKSELPSLKIIHLVGTNGKGTTGRFLTLALHSLGFSVGHYSSPHLLKFNERIFLNGCDVSDETLETAHIKLQEILSDDDSNALSYFEYTTLLGILVFKECDYVIMEAGLGGEHDATAVFDKLLTLVTPIAMDHEAFLGDSIEKIATTKLNAITKEAILAEQTYLEVYEIAKNISKKRNIPIERVDSLLQSTDYLKIEAISKSLDLASYLQENLKLSIAALKRLGLEYVEKDFANSRLFGRLSKIDENIIIDVGHNTLAASSILESLKFQKYILVYNSYKDKDYKKILSILKPIIKRVEIIEIESERGELVEVLQNSLNELEIQWDMFNTIQKDEKYLVFGSFSVVESFLKEYRG